MLSLLTEEVINNLTEAIIDATEAFPETNEFFRKQNTILQTISKIDSLEKISKRRILYNNEFLEIFSEIDLTNKSIVES